MIKICLDPGHYQWNTANRGTQGYYEAKGVLKIAYYLREELQRTGQIQVLLTREESTNPSLSERGSMAGKNGCALFISLHSDAFSDSTANGCTVFYSVDLPNDKSYAEALGNAVAGALGIRFRGAKTRANSSGVEDYYGVIDAAQDSGCPHVFIIEHAFHTNPTEERLLLDDNNLRKIAIAEAKVICAKHGINYVSGGTVVTPPPASTTNFYRVRKSWADVKSQIGAFSDLENAKKCVDANAGYFAFDANGNQVYPVPVVVPPTNPTPTVFYRVRKSWADAASQIGAFTDLANAKACVDKNAGYFAFNPDGIQVYPEPVVTPPPVLTPYRVRKTWEDAATQKGAYNDLENAKKTADANAAEGYKVFDNTGAMVYEGKAVVTEPTTPPVEPPKEYEVGTPIMGENKATIYQMVEFLKAQNAEPKIDVPIEEFCKIYLEEGAAEGVTGDIAFCQSIKETGWFRFNGDVTPETHNYAGLGATGGVNGNGFVDARTGIRAQIQHLKAYGSELPLNQACVDGRFGYIKRGRAIYWEWLGKMENPKNLDGTYTDAQGWAVDGVNYGHDIINIYNKMMELPAEPPVIEEPPVVVEPEPEEPTTPEEPDEPIEIPTETVSALRIVIKFIMDLIKKLFEKK